MGNCVSSQKGNRNKLRKVVVEEGNNVENGKQPLDSAENSVTEKISFGSNSSESISNEEKAPDYFNRARIFPFRELAAVTKNFRDESCIGKGGFGTVYRGNLESTGQAVAVKKLDTEGLQGDEEFLVEILMLSLLRHPNLVTMIGYCAEGDQRLVVYEYVQLGSLETHLHDLPPDQQPLDWNTRMIIYIKKYVDLPPDQQPLDWNTRMMIAYGTAKGLHYLHNEVDPPVIYRDLKSANILLDEGFHPKLSDFGLAKFGPSKDQTHVSTRVMGTQGYCDPEYVSSGMLTMKSDVYSFGVVLLELITGRRALDDNHGRDRQLVAWARPMLRDRRQYLTMVDPRLQGQWSASTMKMAIQLASMCIRHDSIFRPVVAEILQALDCLVSRQNFPIKLRNIANSSSQEDEDSLKETTRILMKQQREQAVAEAKQWGETWRERRRSSLSRHEEFKYMAVDSR